MKTGNENTLQDSVGYIPLERAAEYAANPQWSTGDELLVPIRSGYDTYLGCIALHEPRSPADVTASSLTRIELLAADLAVALEKGDGEFFPSVVPAAAP